MQYSIWVYVCNYISHFQFRATSRINRVVYHPWSDGDLAELKKVSKLGSKFEGKQYKDYSVLKFVAVNSIENQK